MSADTSTPPADVLEESAELDPSLFGEIPRHEGLAAEEVVRPSAPTADSLDRLEEIEASIFGDAPEPAAPATSRTSATDAAPEGRPAPIGAAADLVADYEWTPEQVAEWLEWIVQPKLERDGKRLLTEREIQNGARVWAPPLNILLRRVNPNNPWGAAIAWSLLTFGPRYGPDVMARVRGQAPAEPPVVKLEDARAARPHAARSAAPRENAAEDEAPQGWAVPATPAAA